MIEQGNFSQERARSIHGQIQKFEFPSPFKRLRNRLDSELKIPAQELSEEVASMMDLEIADLNCFTLGFGTRIARLSADNLPQRKRILPRFQSTLKSNPEAVSKYLTHERNSLRLILNQVEQAQQEYNFHLNFDKPVEQSSAEADQEKKVDTINPARNWLEQAHNSGVLLAAGFYDRNSASSSLLEMIGVQSDMIVNARNLVIPEIRGILNDIYQPKVSS